MITGDCVQPVTSCLPEGAWPVMLTAFNDAGDLDVDGLRAICRWYITSGVSGLFACCQSSEIATLSEAEKRLVMRTALEEAQGRAPVIVGAIGQPDDAARFDFARRSMDQGAVGVVLNVAEFGTPQTPEPEVVDSLLEFADAVAEVPLGLYECPQPYHRQLSPTALRRLDESGRFSFMKETSRDLETIAAKIDAVQVIQVFTAFTPLCLAARRRGAAGYSGLATNFCPILCQWLCDHPYSRNPSAEEVQAVVTEAHEQIIRRNYPANAKSMLPGRGVSISHHCRVATDSDAAVSPEQMAQFADKWTRLEQRLR